MFQRLAMPLASLCLDVLCASCSFFTADQPAGGAGDFAGGSVGGSEAKIILYECDSGRQVMARYPDNGDTAILSYQGEEFFLTRVIAASGACYTGDGHEWWGKGDEASLFQGAEGEVLLETCHEGEDRN